MKLFSISRLVILLLVTGMCMACGFLSAQAPKIVFEKYGVAEGLPEEHITSIHQDDQGFIWFTTQNGLVKYDGYDFKTYRASNKDADPSLLKMKNLNGKAIKGKDGKLWMAGVLNTGGIASFDPKTEQFQNYLHDPHQTQQEIPYRDSYMITEDTWGNIWFSNYSYKLKKRILCKLDTGTQAIAQFDFPVYGKLNDVIISSNGAFAEAKVDGSVWILDGDQNLRRWLPGQDSFVVMHRNGLPLPGSSINDSLRALLPGQKDKLLLAGKKGVYIWDPIDLTVIQSYQQDPKDANSLAPGTIHYAFEDHYGNYWVVNYEGNMTFIDPETQTATQYRFGEGKLKFSYGPTQFNYSIIHISTPEKLIFNLLRYGEYDFYLQYDFHNQSFQLYNHNFNAPENQNPVYSNTTVLFEDQSSILWHTYRGSLNKQAPLKHQIPFYTHQDKNPYSLPSDSIRCLFEDSQKRIWIGTYQGLVKYIPEKDHFELISFSSISSNRFRIHRVYEDSENQIWVGGNKGLFLFDEASQTCKPVQVGLGKKRKVTQILEDNQHRLWFSVFSNGVYMMDIYNQKIIKTFQPRQKDSTSLLSNKINNVIFQDSKGRMWIGDEYDDGLGLFRLDDSEEGFIHYTNRVQRRQDISNEEIKYIFEDKQEKIWVGTDGGLHVYDEENDRFQLVGDPIHIPSTASWTKDEQGNLWIGTYAGGGLVKLDPETKNYKVYGESQGLLHNDLQAFYLSRKLSIDHFGYIYCPTRRGLSVFNPAAERFENYFERDGFQPYSSSYSSITTYSGEVWIGGYHGLNRIQPDLLAQKDTTLPAVHITDMTIMDSTFSVPDGKIFSQTVSHTSSISLAHNQNDLGFEFVALHYLRPEANQYSWMLEGHDKDWTQSTLKRQASYTNLDPGTYTFRVKASNADGVWNEEGASMTIVISPPWWATWWARAIFAAIILGIGYLIYRYQLGRQLEHAENLRLKELDGVKTKLYTNITHEFRTPLTVITGMARKIPEQPEVAEKMILRNSQNLLGLVNQMLDLSKLESGNLKLDLIQGDIIGYLQYLTESFHSYAESKDIELVFYPEMSELSMDYDPEKLQHVVSNLLSNAIKFSPKGSKIILHVQQEEKEGTELLVFKVRDKGIGIAADKLPHIFDRFYQADDSSTRKGEGTGIGLTLTRELVMLMGGTIDAESKVDEGSTFIVQLPITRNAPLADQVSMPEPVVVPLPTSHISGEEILVANGDLPQVLIIEDNPDVTFYIKSCLQDQYQLLTAENGAVGISAALEHTPDLIISDVMMPEKDGFEVCHTLKQDERTSHIPIVLLTAKADLESRLAGLQEGADAYLAKPFEKKELLIRIDQLIQLRQNLQARYRDLHGAPVVIEEKYQREDGFLRKVKLIIEERLSDEDLSVDLLARELGMSRSQLFRKLKALTDKSAVAFIRSYRLARAHQLLKTTELSISEVAYEVGFQTPSYFSTAYLKEFGVQPTATRN